MNRIVISSVANFASLFKQHPTLKQLPAFSPLVPIIAQLEGVADKKCQPCKKKKFLNSHKAIFESVLTHLQAFEKNQMKVVMGASQICYYTTGANGKLDITCF